MRASPFCEGPKNVWRVMWDAKYRMPDGPGLKIEVGLWYTRILRAGYTVYRMKQREGKQDMLYFVARTRDNI